MRGTVKKLEGVLASIAQQVHDLEATNEILRVRWATLHLSARLMLEIQRHHEVTAGSADTNDAQIMRLQAIMLSAGGGGLGLAAPRSPAHASSAVGAGTGSTTDALGALGGLLRPGAGACSKQEDASTGAHNGSVAGSPTDNWAGHACGNGGNGAENGGGRRAGSGGVEGTPLLQHLPHLGPGRNLLRLDGVGQEQVDNVRRLSLREAKQRWAAMIREGLELLERAEQERQQQGPGDWPAGSDSGTYGGGPGDACGPSAVRGALAGVASRMDTFMALLCLYNQEVFVAFMASRTDREDGMFAEDDRPVPGVARVTAAANAAAAPAAAGAATVGLAAAEAVAGEDDARPDAPEAFWESVLQRVSPSRAQALLTVEFTDTYLSHVEPLRARQKALVGQLAATPAELRPGGADALRAEAAREALLEEIDALCRAERLEVVVTAQAMRMLYTPTQLLRLWCIAYPWPIHQLRCVAVLRRQLRGRRYVWPVASSD